MICITANGEILGKLVYQTSPIGFKANKKTLYSIYNNSDSTVNRQLQWACIYLSIYLEIGSFVTERTFVRLFRCFFSVFYCDPTTNARV